MQNVRVNLRTIQKILGLFWLLDGFLQLQHYMFTSAFAENTIAPVGMGQPSVVSVPVAWAVHIILRSPVAWDIFFALIQILIGLGFLIRKTVQPAIILSVVWGLGVWLFGEGLGGLLGGRASLITGAPGAVLLYVVLGIAVWPRNSPAKNNHNDETTPAPWLPIAWAVLWLGGVILTLLPANRSAVATTNLVMNQAMSASPNLMNFDAHVNTSILSAGVGSIIILCVLQAGIGIAGLFKKSRAWAAYSGIIVAFIFWVIGQSFGMLLSGSATDPNSGPLIILFAVALLGLEVGKKSVDAKPKRAHST